MSKDGSRRGAEARRFLATERSCFFEVTASVDDHMVFLLQQGEDGTNPICMTHDQAMQLCVCLSSALSSHEVSRELNQVRA